MNKIKIDKLLYRPVMILAIIGSGVLLTNCDLDNYKDYDYVTGAIDPHVDKTAMEFIDARTDVFTIMKDAIDYVDMRSSYEADNDHTYLLLNDNSFRALDPKKNNSGYLKDQFFKSYVAKVILLDTLDVNYPDQVLALLTERDDLVVNGTIRDVPLDSVSRLVKYHILKKNVGESSGWIQGQEFWYETLLFDSDQAKGKISIERDGRYRLDLNGFDGSKRKTRIAQQGIIPTNGIIEVLNGYAEYRE